MERVSELTETIKAGFLTSVNCKVHPLLRETETVTEGVEVVSRGRSGKKKVSKILEDLGLG